MNFLTRLSIRQKLLLIPVLPILLVCYFAIQAVIAEWQQLQVMEQISHYSRLAVEASSLVHEIQKERGLSAGFVGSRGEQLEGDLYRQRLKVDAAVQDFIKLLNLSRRKRLNPVVSRQFSLASDSIADFSDIRTRVDRLDLSLSDILEDYSARNTRLLSLVSSMATLSNNIEISNQASAYFFLLLSKERAGIERAVLSHAFASGALDQELRRRFYALLSEQSVYMSLFQEYARDTDWQMVSRILDGQAIQRIKQIRRIALERGDNFGIRAKEWFDVATLQINLLKRTENQLAKRLRLQVDQNRDAAMSSLIMITLLASSSIAIALLLSLWIVRLINRQVINLSEAVARVEQHSDLSARAEPLCEDELGALARAFNQMLEHLDEAEGKIRMLSQASEQSPVSVVITDLKGNIEYVNRTFEQVTGYRADEVVGKNPSLLKSGNTHPRIYRQMWESLIAGKAWEGEFQNRRKDQSILWESVHIAPVLDDQGVAHHYLAVKADITESKRQAEKITYQANFDALTGLPNRFLSLDRLSQLLANAARHGKQTAVMFLDLDDFKKINDTLGHECGDRVLIEASERLRNVVRDEDTVGRLGGDEFLMLLRDIPDSESVVPIVENIQQAFEKPFRHNGRDLMISTSIGIAIYPDDGDSPAELLRNADTAMYASKREGRNTFHYFTDSMNQKVSRQLILEEQLHGALEREEFHLCYQPLVSIEDQQIIGAEALLRWNNPALGNVPPDEFIAVAEHSELIVHLGQFVLVEALSKAALWREKYLADFQMAVNVSPRQFRNRGFSDDIRGWLSYFGLPGKALELEITEGVLMNPNTHLESILDELQKLNVGISMDDFGTGYSSLSYLRSYPFDCLKIDRSFVNDIGIDSADRELVTAAISMGHGLGLKIVAEGIETPEQLDYLRLQACDVGQGYLFGKPVPAEIFEEILKNPDSIRVRG